MVRVRVLIACEFSGRVRDAFIRRGHDAVSCDLDSSISDAGPHIQTDVRNVLSDGWDMMIAFPPCTHLSNLNCFQGRQGGSLEDKALDFVCELLNAPIPRIALENPIGAINRRVRRSTQIIQPYQFGDPWKKQTHLWLQGLPALIPDRVLPGRHPSWVAAINGKNRDKRRSVTFPGIARAMAEQWGDSGIQ